MPGWVGFVGKRLWQGTLTIVTVAAVNFALVHLAPGNPIDVLAGEAGVADPARTQMLMRQFGLDQPLHVQFLDYIWQLARFDLGYSYHDNEPVLVLITSRLPATLLLMGSAIVLAFLFGVVLGVTASRHVNSAFDQAISFFATLSYATPAFWSGLMLITLFAIHLQWLPTGGMVTVGMYDTWPEHAADVGRHLILPATSLALFYTGIYARLMRASMLEVSRLDYVRAARARGLRERAVYYRHALRNALLPMITMVGVQIASMLGGSVVVETTYGWPGLGRLAFESVERRDYNLLMAILLMSSVLVIAINLLLDFVYVAVDPRIEHGKR